MDELSLLREAHRVDPPDSETIHSARVALGELISSELREAPQPAPRTGRQRQATRPVFVAALALGVLVGVGAAAASGLLGSNTKELVNSSPCNITTDDAHLVASATDSDGGTVELWTLDTADGFGNLVVERGPDGVWLGASMGCDAQPRSSAFAAGQPYAVAPNITDNEATKVRLYGWVPRPATTAIVTLNDGTTVSSAVGAQGFFLHPLTVEPNAAIDVVHIQAVAADGTVVAERDQG